MKATPFRLLPRSLSLFYNRRSIKIGKYSFKVHTFWKSSSCCCAICCFHLSAKLPPFLLATTPLDSFLTSEVTAGVVETGVAVTVVVFSTGVSFTYQTTNCQFKNSKIIQVFILQL